MCVRDEVRRHCRLGLGLLQAPFQLRDLELGRESRVGGRGLCGPYSLGRKDGTQGGSRGASPAAKGDRGLLVPRALEEREAGRRKGKEKKKEKTTEKAERGHQGSVRE